MKKEGNQGDVGKGPKRKMSLNILFHIKLLSGFLTNELRVASYELRVTIYCTSYELLFAQIYGLLLIAQVMSYYLLHELQFELN